MLVVIAIIAILAALLLPALARANASGKSVACKSNLRQLGIALTMYVHDWEKYPGPVMPEDGGPLEVVGPGTGWSGPLNAYLPGEGGPNMLLNGGDSRAYRQRSSVFTCPAVPRQWLSTLGGSSNGGWAYVSSYGYNIKGTGWVPGNVQDLGLGPRRVGVAAQSGNPGTILWTTESQVRVASDMIAIGDAYEEGLRNPHWLVPDAPWVVDVSYLVPFTKEGPILVFATDTLNTRERVSGSNPRKARASAGTTITKAIRKPGERVSHPESNSCATTRKQTNGKESS